MISDGPSVLRLAAFVNGNPFKPSDLGDRGLPVIRIRQLLDVGAPIEYAVPPARPVLIDQGDLIFSWSATLAVRHWHGEPALLNQHLFRVDPVAGIDRRWMGYVLRVGIERLKPLMHGSAMTHITLDMLRRLSVSVPDLHRQVAIADYLDTETARIDTLISKKRRLIGLLAEYRTALIAQTVTRGLYPSRRLRPSGVDWLGDIPTHWGSPKISHVAVLGSGHTPSRSVPEWWVPQECTVPWITTGEVANLRSDRIEYIERTRECVSEIGLANSSAVVHPAGTVVLSRTASVGYSGIMATDMATSQDFATWTCGPNLLPRFLLLCLRAMRPDLLGRLTMGSTHKTIYMPDIQSLAIPLPPMSEQHQIINAVWKQLKRLGAVEDRITAQISLLRESRQALISAAVTGDLATPGLATETPTVRPISS